MNDLSDLPAPDGQRWMLVPTGRDALAVQHQASPAREISAADIWHMLVRWRFVIIGAAVAGLALGIATTLMMTRIYRATTTLEISSESTKVIEVGNVEPLKNADAEYMGTQLALLQSRSLAERVARQLALAGNPAVGGTGTAREARESRAAGVLMRGLKVEPVRNSRLVRVSFSDHDPALAARVANGFAENFIASNLERRFETTAYARDFLQKRIASVKTKLEQSERQLVDYARTKNIILVGAENPQGAGNGDGGSSLVSQSLVAANQALSSAQTDRIAAEERYRQANGSRTNATTLQSPTVQGLRQQRADLQSQYDENLNLYKPDFPAMVRLKARLDTLTRNIQQESGEVVGSLRGDYLAAVGRENESRARVVQLQNSVQDLRNRSIQYNIIQREVDTNRTLYDGLLQRYKEVGVAGGVGESLVAVVDRARVPTAPVQPILWLNVLIGVVGALSLSVGAVIAIEFIDDTITTPDDVTGKLKLTPLGVIPRAPKSENFVQLLADPQSPVSEAYLSVRTALQFTTERGIPRTLLITSSRPAEGKSSTSLALAQNFARGGRRVVLVDADLRKPTFRTKSNEVYGLSNLLTGDTDINRAIHTTSSDNLFILPSGHIPPNPADLLAGNRMREVIEQLSETFEQVVIDGPPVLGLADAPLLASMAEGTVVVIESGGVRRPLVLNTIARLRAADARLVGVILTKFNERMGVGGYGYGYGYGYGGNAYSYGNREESKMIDVATHSA